MRISTDQIYQNGISNLMTQQERLLKLSDQAISNIRVRTPADDPIAAAQIELVSKRISTAEMLQKNREFAKGALSLEEGTLSNVGDSIRRLLELQTSGGDGSYSQEARQALAVEAKAILNDLVTLANSRDTNGGFMFSGGKSTTQAISLNGAGQYVYNGDTTQRFQTITGSLVTALNDTGDNLFMNILNGNGAFAISSPAIPNTGSGSVSSGALVTSSAYVPDDYTMNFALNSSGALVVMVSGATSGNVIPPTGLPDDAPLYQDGGVIDFNGIELSVSGTPAPGDSFNITPSQNESLFSTVQRMITNLERPNGQPAEKALILTENNQLLEQLNNAHGNILNSISDLGSRLNQLDSADNTNYDVISTSALTLKALREIEPYEALSQYQQQLLTLNIAEQSYTKLQGLSIFNYI